MARKMPASGERHIRETEDKMARLYRGASDSAPARDRFFRFYPGAERIRVM